MNDTEKKSLDEFYNQMNAGLQKHIDRNNAFLQKHNFIDTFFWMQDHIKDPANKTMTRTAANSDLMNAMLMMQANYNGVMMNFSKDELDENECLDQMTRIDKLKKIITDLKK